MSHPLVSIGVPVYNGEKFVRRSLDSLLSQDYPNIEIIISDNDSTDNTRIICEEYSSEDSRITYIRQEGNVGIVNNFKYVLNHASGLYFMWAAVDDSWDSSFISCLAKKLDSNPKFAVAQSATRKVSESNMETIGYERFAGANNPEKDSILKMTRKLVSIKKYNFFIYGLFRRKILIEAFQYMLCVASSDRWLLLQLPLAGYNFAYVDEPLYNRTIADSPVYVRYVDDLLGVQIKNNENIWFRFDSISAVKNMLENSSLVLSKNRYYINIIILQLIISRVKLGFRLMIKVMVIRWFPKNIVRRIVKIRKKCSLRY